MSFIVIFLCFAMLQMNSLMCFHDIPSIERHYARVIHWDAERCHTKTPFVSKIAVECKESREISAHTDVDAVCHILGIPLFILPC